MNRVVRRSFTAGAVALVCACTSDNGSPLIGPGQTPVMEIRDGRNGGNPHFFFLAPIRPLSLQPPKTAPFNPDLSPVVEVCELTAGACTQQIARLTMSTGGFLNRVYVSRQFEEYGVLWRTDHLNLSALKTYRIRVVVGTRELGFADVDVVRTFREATQVDREEFVPLLRDFILPIRFRIQEGALCDAGSCNSTSIDLSEGGFVVLEATGDRVDIPAQQSDQVVTITLRQCGDLDIDLPVFGNCLQVTADPPLAARLSPAATVSMCSLNPLTIPLPHPQQDLLTLHRQDGELVTALPHADDFCVEGFGRADDREGWWRAVKNAAAWIFKPAELHASTMVLDVGAGGQTDAFSDFQFALPAKMDAASLVDQVTDPNSPVPSVPSVLITDADGNPVPGARVHFQITSGGGSIAPLAAVATSDALGRAALTQWVLGEAGSHTLQAFGKGIADPENDGPAEGFEPFAPAIFHDPELNAAQPPVALGTGRLTFRATAIAGQPDLMIERIVVGPSDLSFTDEVTHDVTVRNRGSAGAPATTVFLDGPAGLSGDVGADVLNVPALNAGDAATLRSRLGPRVPGTASVSATVDPNHTISESNEENNTFTTEPFTVVPKIDFETLGNGTPITSIALPLALVNEYALQGVTFAFVRFDETPGVASLCNSSAVDPEGITNNHSATIQASGDPCAGFTLGELVVTFSPDAGLPTSIQFQVRGNDDIGPFSIIAFYADGNELPIPRSDVSTYTSNNGSTARQETVVAESPAGIVQIRINLPPNTGAVFIDELVIIR